MMKLNRIVTQLPESETLFLNAKVKELAQRGKKVFNLTAGELDFSTPPAIRRAVLQHLSENKYTPVLGLPVLRWAIAKTIAKVYGLKSASPANIAVTAGAKQGLSEVFQVILNRGDEVIIPIPAWPSYEQQVKLAGGRPVFVPMSVDFDLDAKSIKAAFTPKTKAIIINSPHNPTGKLFSERALKQVSKSLAGRRIYIIADTIYQSLVYVHKMPKLSHYFKKNLILIDGFSKSHALTGWRIGYVAAGSEIINILGRLQSHTSGNTSVLSQAAGIAAACSPKITAGFVRALVRRRKFVAEHLDHIPGISFMLPDGAFYFFLDISKLTRDSKKFCRRLLQKTGVAVVPGEVFRAPGFVRLSFAAPEKELREGVRRLAEFVKLYPA